jgi:hypothetical protein
VVIRINAIHVTSFSERYVIVAYLILLFFRFMETMEDTLSTPLCGLFLLLLSGMCFGAMSAITVKYPVNNYYDIVQKL